MAEIYRRYRHAERLFAERRFLESARELEALLAADAEVVGAVVVGTGQAALLLARAYFLAAALGNAERVAREVLTTNPSDPDTLRLLVRILQRTGRHTEAAGWVRRMEAFGVDPQEHETYSHAHAGNS